ncbi:conserved hypothetical protein [Sphingobium indicum UT26S]|uniref:Pentapeptide repeat-containing protein n=1 Tax=Sphingobium indicum (strain DSM 16413 / CCM 7287 / MTCC 6362 / UT26 / NBRC 101211 / UT26S) TaxID=452662 RepID=D4Z5D0_SPHIU|nr:conserved hypothetical protein [Sphingobium indicum UT26S]
MARLSGCLCQFYRRRPCRIQLPGQRFQQCRLPSGEALWSAVQRMQADWRGLYDASAMEIGIEETLLINARLPGFSFRHDRLRKVDFSQADLRKCDFRQVVFEECSLRDASMAGSRFDGADLRGADIGGLRLVDASLFRGATLSRAQAGELLGELGLKVR